MEFIGRAKNIEDELDSIILQNDKIENEECKRRSVLKDGDDLGISHIIKSLEKSQQDSAESISKLDQRGTVRARMLIDYTKFIATPGVTDEMKLLAKNRLMTMGLLSIYRLRTAKQTKIVREMLGALPTTGRDYTVFRRNWEDWQR